MCYSWIYAYVLVVYLTRLGLSEILEGLTTFYCFLSSNEESSTKTGFMRNKQGGSSYNYLNGWVDSVGAVSLVV